MFSIDTIDPSLVCMFNPVCYDFHTSILFGPPPQTWRFGIRFWFLQVGLTVNKQVQCYSLPRWWFQICIIFTPSWANDPIWGAYFLNGLGKTTSGSKIFTGPGVDWETSEAWELGCGAHLVGCGCSHGDGGQWWVPKWKSSGNSLG